MDRFEVVLNEFPGDQVPFVAAMRTVGGLSLADAIAIHRYASNALHTVLVAGIDRVVADHVVANLAAAGIDAAVRTSTVTSPMICRPTANVAYRWDALRRVVAIRNPQSGPRKSP